MISSQGLKPGESRTTVLPDGTKATVTRLSPTDPRLQNLHWIKRPRERRPCQHLGEPTDDQFPPEEGLGDYVADALTAIGVTKERFAELKATFAAKRKAKEEGCGGCNRRQRLFNWIGKKLGMAAGQGPELQKLLTLTELPQQTVHQCGLHGRCLPRLSLPPDQRQVVVDAGFTPCHGCQDFAAVAAPQ